MNIQPSQFAAVFAELVPYPAVFVAISGAHLYGFASPTSDVDLRGCHILPVRTMLGLGPIKQEIHRMLTQADLTVDLVSEDLVRYAVLLLQQRGNYLEQLFSPLVVVDTPWAEELRALVRAGAITRQAYHHYAGFARGQWQRWRKELETGGAALKTLLYAYRVSLTGLHLLRTGEVETNLTVLARLYGYDELPDLIAAKTADQAVSIAADRHEAELARLQDLLTVAYENSPLPAAPTNREALEDFVIRVRMTVFRHELG